MARNKVDTCFICMQAPCQCNAKKKQPAKKRTTAPKPPPESKPQVEASPQPQPPRKSFLAAMKNSATTAPPSPAMKPPSAPPPPPKPRVVQTSDEELILNDALRTLDAAGLLCEADRQRYRAILTTAPSPGELAATWKARRRALGGDVGPVGDQGAQA